MVSAVSEPFFAGRSNLKSNSRSYLEHLRNDLIPAMKELYPNNNFTFIQDSVPSHRAKIVQNVLREEFKSRFVANTEWLPASPGCNSLYYYLWSEVKEKVYSGHHAKPFESENESQGRIFSVWDQCTKMLNCFVKQLNSFYDV